MTRSQTVRKWFHAVAGVSAILTGTAACSGTGRAEGGPAFGTTGGAYDLTCSKTSAEHAIEVAERKYIPPELIVHDWPGTEKTVTKSTSLSENDFIMGLLAPQRADRPLRTTLVMARGGTGKSKLAESIAAQSCKSAPVFRVDLNTDIAAHLEEFASGQNPIAVYLSRQNKLDTKPGAETALNQAVGDQIFVVVLDSLDEVPLLQRTTIAAAIDDFVTRVNPRARLVVMTRPPVFTSNYGLKTVDGRLELPQLNCVETDAAIARALPDPNDRKNFDAFLQRYRIDRKVTTGDRCYYPHLSTHRDLQVVQRLVRNAQIDQDHPDFKQFQASRAQVYTYFLTAQLLKDLQDVDLLPNDALKLIDRIVAAKSPENGERNLPITLPDCVSAATGKVETRQASCERLLQSSLFKPSAENGEHHFDNQSVGDLFLARWTASELEAHGNLDDARGRYDCSAVTSRASLLESNEVAGFLVGQPPVQKCLAPIAVELCRRGGYAAHIYEQFDQGLPAGAARKAIIDAADKQLGAMSIVDHCAGDLLDQLGRVPGETVAPVKVSTPGADDASVKVEDKAGAAKPGKKKKGK